MFGKVQKIPQNELTPFYPQSPYGAAKVYAHWITINYREAYNIFAVNGILFNHESPRRGETFVTRKIIKALCKIRNNLQKTLYLGNLYAKRDWGHARDYVEAMHKVLQNNRPDDYVIATGIQHTVREMITVAFEHIGIRLSWWGEDINERAVDQNGRTRVIVDPKYYRPNEVEDLLGDASRAAAVLNWSPSISFENLIQEMVDNDIEVER